jgi:DNA mismatch repair ATPase MutL
MYVQKLDENCVTELCAAQILIDLKSCIQELVDNAIDAKSNEIS